MSYYTMPELSPEEKNMPLAAYFTKYPLCVPPPMQRMLLDCPPMDPADAVPAGRWLDILIPDKYRKVEFGYCMMPDGSGYYAEYYVTPDSMTSDMRRWFGQWVNHRSKSMVCGQGNLRYKLWNPIDHWDHKFVNGIDDKDGVWSMESLDLGQGSRPASAISHRIDLGEYGLTRERQSALESTGCRMSAVWEEFEGPGHHLVLRFSRPCPFGGTEHLNHEWIGYYAKDGKIIRDVETPVDEAYLKNVLTHNTVEHLHLPKFLPELYAEYHTKPVDAD